MKFGNIHIKLQAGTEYQGNSNDIVLKASTYDKCVPLLPFLTFLSKIYQKLSEYLRCAIYVVEIL